MRTFYISLSVVFALFSSFFTVNAQDRQTLQQEQSTIPTTTVLQEDFSRWTAGTNDSPDTKALGGKSVDYKIPDALMAQKGWIGSSVYQAGGACALKMYYSDAHGSTTGGYIDTPEMELYGTVVLTLRARRQVAGSKANMRIALCDNYEGPLDDRIIELSDDWKEYRFETNKALFGSIEIFQIEAWNGDILIDDINMTRKRDIIESPYALEPVNNSSTSFTARWEPTKSAKSYVVNVYRKEMPAGEVYKGTLIEGFDKIQINTDGKTINTENPNCPEGWTVDLSSNGTRDVYTEQGWYYSGSCALCFDEEGDIVESPELKAPLAGFSFWVRPSSMENEADYFYSMLGVSIFHRNTQKWETIANMPNYYISNSKGEFYSFTPEQLGDDAVKVRIEMVQHNNVSFAVDDITLDYCTQRVPVTQLVKEVTDTFLVVNDVDPQYEYYYNVAARDGELHSVPSEDIWVNGVEGLKAEALPATGISADGFTANWNTKATASAYKLNVYRYLDEAKEDIPNMTLIHENFDNIDKGSLSNPYNPWLNNINYAELGFASTEWQGQLPLYVEGMAGANAFTQWTGMNGLVVSPKLSLTADGGAFDVDLTVYGTKGDGIYVMLLSTPFSGDALAYQELIISQSDVATAGTVHFDAVADLAAERNNVYVVLMSKKGQMFFVDDIAIRQNIKKGDSVWAPFCTLMTADDHHTFTGLDSRFDYQYDVVAIAHKSFTDYKSDPSDLVTVAVASSIGNAVSATGVRAGKSSIEVNSDVATPVAVYDITGRMVSSASVVTGNHTFSLPSGLYVVRACGKTTKVLVP